MRVDSAFPVENLVTFTDPGGSSLSSTPASGMFTESGGEESGAGYFSPLVNATSPSGGTYTVNYKGQDVKLTVVDPDVARRQVIPVPTVMLDGDVIKSVSWVYKDKTTGTPVGPQSFMRSISIRISDAFGPLFQSVDMPPTATSVALDRSTMVNWSNVTNVSMFYNDTFDNGYNVSFQRDTAPSQPNLTKTAPGTGATRRRWRR